MRHRLATALLVVSLAMLLASTFLWWRSYQRWDTFVARSPANGIGIQSAHGCITINLKCTDVSRKLPPKGWSSSKPVIVRLPGYEVPFAPGNPLLENFCMDENDGGNAWSFAKFRPRVWFVAQSATAGPRPKATDTYLGFDSPTGASSQRAAQCSCFRLFEGLNAPLATVVANAINFARAAATTSAARRNVAPNVARFPHEPAPGNYLDCSLFVRYPPQVLVYFVYHYPSSVAHHRGGHMSDRAKFQAAARKWAIDASVADVASRLVENARPVVDAGCQKLSKVNESLPPRANGKPNPPRPLRPRGLAIARLLVQGKTVSEIATALGVTRQAIWKWSRRPEVVGEVNRAHAAMLAVTPRRG